MYLVPSLIYRRPITRMVLALQWYMVFVKVQCFIFHLYKYSTELASAVVVFTKKYHACTYKQKVKYYFCFKCKYCFYIYELDGNESAKMIVTVSTFLYLISLTHKELNIVTCGTCNMFRLVVDKELNIMKSGTRNMFGFVDEFPSQGEQPMFISIAA